MVTVRHPTALEGEQGWAGRRVPFRLGSGCRRLPASDSPTQLHREPGALTQTTVVLEWPGLLVGTQGSQSSGGFDRPSARAVQSSPPDLIKHVVASSSADLDLLPLQPWAPGQGARDQAVWAPEGSWLLTPQAYRPRCSLPPVPARRMGVHVDSSHGRVARARPVDGSHRRGDKRNRGPGWG